MRRPSPYSCFPILCGLILVSVGCGDADPAPNTAPHVTGIEVDQVVIGQSLNFYGSNFLAPSEGVTQLELEGTYVWEDENGNAIPEQVAAFRVTPVSEGPFPEATDSTDETEESDGEAVVLEQVLRLNRFGPYLIPFQSEGRALGTFKGTVRAINVHNDGFVTQDSLPVEIALEIQPSILITKLEPVTGANTAGDLKTAECDSPALRVFGGLPYILEVEAVGFEPAYFVYEISTANNSPDYVTFTHPATGAVDRLGDPTWVADEILVFNRLPDDVELAIVSIRVTAIDANDNTYFTGLPVPVVRPLAFSYTGNRELGELYEPLAVHGPIVGGIGTVVSYAESHTESRQRGVSVGVNTSFMESHGSVSNSTWSEGVGVTNTVSTTNTDALSLSEYESSSETYGTSYTSSESNDVSFASTTGSDWGWNVVEGSSEEQFTQEMDEIFGDVSGSVTTEVGAEGSIPGIAKVSGKVGTTVGATVGGRTSDTNGVSSGTSVDSGSHLTENESSSTAFGSVTTDSQSENVSGTYSPSSPSTLSSQPAYSAATSESVTYNVGGSEGITENYTVGQTELWSETWTETSSDTTLLSYSSKVPRERCAMIYRQTARYVRTAHLYSHDLCGVRSLVGELYFNEWSWSPNIAIGDDCDTSLPESTLPAATCYIGCD